MVPMAPSATTTPSRRRESSGRADAVDPGSLTRASVACPTDGLNRGPVEVGRRRELAAIAARLLRPVQRGVRGVDEALGVEGPHRAARGDPDADTHRAPLLAVAARCLGDGRAP